MKGTFVLLFVTQTKNTFYIIYYIILVLRLIADINRTLMESL